MKKAIALLTFFFGLMGFAQEAALKADYNAGQAFYKQKQYNEAIASFRKVLTATDITKLKKVCHINIGLSHNELKEYGTAINDFTEAIKLDSTDMTTFIDRGLCKMRNDDNAGALQDLTYAATSRQATIQNKEAGLYWQARINQKSGMYAQAVKNCDDYIMLNSADHEIHFIRGTANDGLFKFAEAIKDYSKAIELNPEYFEAYANRGTAKINEFTTTGTVKPTRRQTASACDDFKKARSLGDTTVGDMIYVHCGEK